MSGPRASALARTGGAAALAALTVAAAYAGSAPSSAIAATTTTVHTTTTVRKGPTTTTKTRPTGPTSTVASTTTATVPTTTTTTRPSRTTTTTVPPAPPAKLAAPGVSLVSQPAWIPTGGAEVMKLHLDEPALATTPGAQVAITIHNSVSSRTDFDRAISGDSLGNTRGHMTIALSSLQVNKRHEFLVGFGLPGSGANRQIGIESAGVYPVEVGVVDSGTDRGTFVTWMIVVNLSDARASAPLRVSWIWRLESPPLELPSGITLPSALTAMRPGGRLDRIATLLARAGSFPLTLGIGPQMLATWTRSARTQPALARGADRVRRAAARPTNQLLPEPYVPIDIPTLEAERLGAHLPGEYVAGSSAIERATGQIPDPRTAFVDPINDAAVSRLTQMLVGRFVVRDTSLVPVAEQLTPAQPFTLTTATGITGPAIATDTGVERLIDSPGPPALREQRVLAALAEIAYEAPSQPRGVVLATPPDWSPDRQTTTMLLHDLARDPLVRPATLDTLFSEVNPAESNGSPLQRQLAPSSVKGPLPLHASEYDAAIRDLKAFQSMVGRQDPAVAAGRNALLLALSTENSRAQALALRDTISVKLNVLTSGITTTAKTLTITARRAKLPISFQNNTKRAGVRILVHLDSPKLVFPKGPNLVIPLPLGHTTIEFPVEARASGTFAMTITLKSADGSIEIGAPTRVTIRSAVFSGIGIALTLGALLFLAGWWSNHFFRTRRARRRAQVT